MCQTVEEKEEEKGEEHSFTEKEIQEARPWTGSDTAEKKKEKEKLKLEGQKARHIPNLRRIQRKSTSDFRGDKSRVC